MLFRSITMADLKGTLELLMKRLYGEDTQIRLRPHHYEGVQNDSYRYCREAIWWAFKETKRHHSCFIYVGVRGCQMIVSRTKRGLRRNGLKYIEKKRMFYNLLSRY